jgi:hypothetical protein
MSHHPASEQLLDLFNWASPGMLVTDANGAVVLANKAATELLRNDAAAGTVVATALGVPDYAALLAAGTPVENREATFANPDFASGYANLGFGQVDGRTYGFWALRPVTTHPTPSPAPAEGSSTAQAWIDQVNRSRESYVPVDAEAVPFLQAYYDNCPVAIHLIEEDGTVAYANWKDIAIVGAPPHPPPRRRPGRRRRRPRPLGRGRPDHRLPGGLPQRREAGPGGDLLHGQGRGRQAEEHPLLRLPRQPPAPQAGQGHGAGPRLLSRRRTSRRCAPGRRAPAGDPRRGPVTPTDPLVRRPVPGEHGPHPCPPRRSAHRPTTCCVRT